MSKEQTLAAIEKATQSHTEQLQKIENVLSGKNIKDPTALSKTKCAFGMWLYDDNSKLKEIMGVQFYEKIDHLHEAWHLHYAKIYAIYFEEQSEGFLSKLFGKKVSSLQKDKAKLYFTELREITEQLLKALDVAKRRVQALSESKFN